MSTVSILQRGDLIQFLVAENPDARLGQMPDREGISIVYRQGFADATTARLATAGAEATLARRETSFADWWPIPAAKAKVALAKAARILAEPIGHLDPKTVAAEIRRIRTEDFKTSLEGLAQIAGVSRTTVYHWEEGTREPTLSAIARIRAVALQLNIPWDGSAFTRID